MAHTGPSQEEIAAAVKRGMEMSKQIRSRSKTPSLRCEVCNVEVEADLMCHGPGIASFYLDCGHTVTHTKDSTTYEKNGVVDLVVKPEQ